MDSVRVWLVIGLVLYFAYGYQHSTLRRGKGSAVHPERLSRKRPDCIHPRSPTLDRPPAAPKSFLRRISLSQWILIAMVVGIFLGWAFPENARDIHGGWAATDLNVLSSVFLRMIKSLIVPLLFATLVVGIAGHGDDMKRVGRLAFRSIIYFEIVTTLALAVGLIAVNVVKPGRGRGPRRRRPRRKAPSSRRRTRRSPA